jgi:hypothetical protein
MYETLLGKAAWDALPDALRAIHAPGRARGRLHVRRGAGRGARLIAWVCGFPRAARDVDLALEVSARGASGLRWDRHLGATRLVTEQRIDDDGLISERFGPFVIGLEPWASTIGLDLVQRRASLAVGPWRLWLPRCLAPRVRGRARAAGGGARIEVSVHAPLVGLLLAYDGVVEVADAHG